MHYFPSFYIQDESGYTDIGHSKGWLVVFVIFGLERLLIFTGLLFMAVIPEVPEDVSDELERRQYIHLQEEEERNETARKKKEK